MKSKIDVVEKTTSLDTKHGAVRLLLLFNQQYFWIFQINHSSYTGNQEVL